MHGARPRCTVHPGLRRRVFVRIFRSGGKTAPTLHPETRGAVKSSGLLTDVHHMHSGLPACPPACRPAKKMPDTNNLCIPFPKRKRKPRQDRGCMMHCTYFHSRYTQNHRKIEDELCAILLLSLHPKATVRSRIMHFTLLALSLHPQASSPVRLQVAYYALLELAATSCDLAAGSIVDRYPPVVGDS